MRIDKDSHAHKILKSIAGNAAITRSWDYDGIIAQLREAGLITGDSKITSEGQNALSRLRHHDRYRSA